MVKKAMILAAGFGTRLQPLTHVKPKPLVPVCNVPLLGVHLHQLAAIGVEEVMINLHHLPVLIQEQLRALSLDLRLSFSLESPEILGTGGGLNKVRDFFAGEEDFLVANGDILHGIDWETALLRRRQSGACGTLILREHPGTPGMGYVGVAADGEVTRVPEMEESVADIRRAFSGLHVLTPAIFEFLPEGFGCILRTGYRGMLEAGLKVNECFVGDAPWMDIGKPDAYLQANLNPPVPLLQRRARRGTGVIIEEGASVDELSVLGDGVIVRSGASVKESVVWGGLEVRAGETLRRAIRYEAGESVEVSVPESLGGLTRRQSWRESP